MQQLLVSGSTPVSDFARHGNNTSTAPSVTTVRHSRSFHCRFVLLRKAVHTHHNRHSECQVCSLRLHHSASRTISIPCPGLLLALTDLQRAKYPTSFTSTLSLRHRTDTSFLLYCPRRLFCATIFEPLIACSEIIILSPVNVLKRSRKRRSVPHPLSVPDPCGSATTKPTQVSSR